MKLRNIISESDWFEDDSKVSNETRAKFLEAVKNYNALGKAIYREGNLLEVAKTLESIGKVAEKFTLQETGEWFDKVTVQRNMRDLKGLGGQFTKFATEAQQLQDRMSALYEDMGHILNRYYSIDELQDELEQGQQQRNQLKQEYDSDIEYDDYECEVGCDDNVEEARYNYDDEEDIQSARYLAKIRRQKKKADLGRKVKFSKRTNNESVPTKLNLTLGGAGFDPERMRAAVGRDKWMQVQLKTKYGGNLKKLWQAVGYGD